LGRTVWDVNLEPYTVLGLPRGASNTEVRRAYRRLAQESHPDTNGPSGVDRFISVQRAYEAISREKEGAAYGPTGSAVVPGSASVPGTGPSVPSPPPPSPTRVDLFDVLMPPSVALALAAYRRLAEPAPAPVVDLVG
jgi:preprotein translocase subunit Sec63